MNKHHTVASDYTMVRVIHIPETFSSLKPFIPSSSYQLLPKLESNILTKNSLIFPLIL